MTVVGARPQFIKAAVVSKELRKNNQEVIIHTGQHFDYNMSETFFEELDIPKPDYNLGISGGTHAEMTGRMMIAIEQVLMKEQPDWVLVFGDTNSTLAAALAAAKLHCKLCHVEAGIRVNNKNNPEEINRICTDHLADLLFASTKSGYDEMGKEGLKNRAYLVGDPMYDAYLKYCNMLQVSDVELELLQGGRVEVPSMYYYLTCHREENTKDDSCLSEILRAMEMVDYPVVYPVHPRNKERALRIRNRFNYRNTLLVEPVGYLESVCLLQHSNAVITDSGGVQREAFFAQKKCVTLLDFVCWPETMVDNRNVLCKPIAEDIVKAIKMKQIINSTYRPFGDGDSAEKIVKILESIQSIN